jgi:hypothetical protein
MNAVLAFVANVLQSIQSALSSFAGALLGTPPTQRHNKDLSLEIVRSDDLLVLTFDFYNVVLTPASGAVPARLGRRGSGDVFMVVRFPPQSFGEQAFLDDSAEPKLHFPAPVESRIAGESQIVLAVSDAQLPLDLTLEALLKAFEQSEPLVQRTTRVPPPVPSVGQAGDFNGPRGQFTAIEAPFRLVLSHGAGARWDHAVAAAKSGERTELWHTRLSAGAGARAVWSPDIGPPAPPPTAKGPFPFLMSLSPSDRHSIVQATSNTSLTGNKPVAVDRFMLSSQGAWLNVFGKWQISGLDLIEWKHILTGGRDQYARVVKEGRLFPFGHRAMLVTITERKLAIATAGKLEGKPAAYLLQRSFVVVRQPAKDFTYHGIPFRRVTIKTLTTPDLKPAADTAFNVPSGFTPEDSFWPIPLNTSEAYRFHLVATDWEGREIDLHMPLAFIGKVLADTKTAEMATIVAAYNLLADNDEHRLVAIGGQKIAYAPFAKPGDTTFDTAEMIFGASDATGSPLFLPAMAKASVNVPAVEQITGKPAHSTIELVKEFVEASGDTIGNMGEMFARLSGIPPKVEFSTEKTGGLVAPNFDIGGLSRAYGPVGDAATFAGGKFDPGAVFAGVKLLGCIELGQIIRPLLNLTPALARQKVPGLQSLRTTKDGLGDVIETRYAWEVPKEQLADNIPGFAVGNDARFTITTTIDAPLGEKAPQFSIVGSLKDFTLTLLPKELVPDAELVGLKFNSITFKAESNRKPDFSLIFGGFEFKGMLSFVNKLRDFIPLDGFNDPRPGVNVGFTQGIPTIGIGIFTLQNISFGAGFYLPLIGGSPNLRLAFCERHQPFTLTVSLFGGGGFFAMEINLERVQLVEAALEFGAAIALNLGVASGSACVMGGVYYQTSGGAFAFSAYFRAAGALSVLGIITVSVELYIALNYSSKGIEPHPGHLWGEASVTVKVKIAFFSKSVSIAIERVFAGSDPTFQDTLALSDWSEYCAAFADYPA